MWNLELNPGSTTAGIILESSSRTSLNVTVDEGTSTITIAGNSRVGVTDLVLPSGVMGMGDQGPVIYSVTAISREAFSRSQLKSITIPYTVKRMDGLSFNNCSNLETVVFEDGGMSLINTSSFANCPNLKNVTLHNGLREIGPTAFSGSGLTSIEIPASVTEIGHDAFQGCQSLATVTFKGDGLTKIGENAFKGTVLTGIDLPSTLQEIGDGAFYGINTLTSITIPALVETLGSEVFYLSGLTSVKFLGNKITEFSAKTFGQTPLTDITIPNGVETIKQEAFQLCEELESVTIPASVTTIEKWAFQDDPKLTKITYLGETEPAIADKAFGRDYQTPIVPGRKIYLPKGKGDPSTDWHYEKWGVASVNDLIFSGWEYDSSKKTLSMDKTVINNVTADGKKLTIGDNSALDLSELSLPDSAKDVDPAITDAYAITAIAPGAFKQNAKLTKITLPATVTKIGDNAFAGTITELHLLHETPDNLEMHVSGLDKSSCVVYVPNDKLKNFHTTDPDPYWSWNGFPYILEEGGEMVAINYEDKDGNAWAPDKSLLSEGSLFATKAPVGQTFVYVLNFATKDSSLVFRSKDNPAPNVFSSKNDTILTLATNEKKDWTLIVTVLGPIKENTVADEIVIIENDTYKKDGTEDSFNGTITETTTPKLTIGTSANKEIKITMKDVEVKDKNGEDGTTTIEQYTKTYLTLEGTNNNLGKLTNNGTLILTSANRKAIKLKGSITNAGTFMDSTGIVTSVGGAANLAILPMSDQTVITGGSAKLEAKAKVGENAGSVITDYVWFKKGADGEWTQVKPALPAPNLLSSRSSLLRDATTEKDNELTVESADASEYRCEVTSKDEATGNIVTTLTVFATVTLSDPTPDPVTYSVILPEVEGAKTDPQANTYWRTEGDSFSFTLTLDAEYDQSKPIVKVGDKEIKPNAAGKYVIESIYEDIKISISGIEKNTTVGNAEVEAGEAKVWSDNGVLHIYTPVPARVRVVNFIGSPVKDLGTVNGDTQTTLPKGSYIIVIGDSTTKIAL